jgi:hypothetical protein
VLEDIMLQQWIKFFFDIKVDKVFGNVEEQTGGLELFFFFGKVGTFFLNNKGARGAIFIQLKCTKQY